MKSAVFFFAVVCVNSSYMIDLGKLRYFVMVADQGSITKAARQLGVAQPTISIQISRLEKELGISLLDRGRQGVELTEAGRRLYKKGREVLKMVSEAERSLYTDQEAPTGPLRIGVVNSVGIYLLPEVLAAYLQRFPKVQPEIKFEHSGVVMEQLASGEIDLAITARRSEPGNARSILLFHDPLLLTFNREHRFVGRKSIKTSDLDGEVLVTLDQTSPTGSMIKEVLESNSVTCKQVIAVSQIKAVVEMIKSGIGIGFLPTIVLGREADQAGLFTVALPVEEFRRGIWVSWNDDSRNPAREMFVDTLHATISDSHHRDGTVG